MLTLETQRLRQQIASVPFFLQQNRLTIAEVVACHNLVIRGLHAGRAAYLSEAAVTHVAVPGPVLRDNSRCQCTAHALERFDVL